MGKPRHVHQVKSLMSNTNTKLSGVTKTTEICGSDRALRRHVCGVDMNQQMRSHFLAGIWMFLDQKLKSCSERFVKEMCDHLATNKNRNWWLTLLTLFTRSRSLSFVSAFVFTVNQVLLCGSEGHTHYRPSSSLARETMRLFFTHPHSFFTHYNSDFTHMLQHQQRSSTEVLWLISQCGLNVWRDWAVDWWNTKETRLSKSHTRVNIQGTDNVRTDSLKQWFSTGGLRPKSGSQAFPQEHFFCINLLKLYEDSVRVC